jgi:hypothetical protein
MRREPYPAEEIVNRLREAAVSLSRGRTIAGVCEQIGISERT